MVGEPLRRVVERAAARRFTRREVTIAPGCGRDYDEGEWHDALVVVTGGELIVEGRGGARIRLVDGDVLWLTGLGLRALRNDGEEPTVLVAISRPIGSRRPPVAGRPGAGG